MSQTEPKAVLAVADPETARAVRRILEPGGCVVHPTTSTAQACELMAARRYVLTVADLHLPDGSGLSVIARACRRDPSAVGILLASRAQEPEAVRALSDEVYDYVLKPFAPDALLAACCRALERRQMIAELEQKTAELEKAEKRLAQKSNMIRNVSHELRNPLSVVFGYSAFLLKQEPGEFTREDLRTSLENIHTNASRLSTLLEEMAESTRISAGKVALSREPATAAGLCAQAVEAARFEAMRRSIDLRLMRVDERLVVNADPARAQQVLGHLIDNALKFTPGGGSVAVSALADEGFARFCVKDTGSGIPPEDLPHVFERFFHAAGVKKAQTGLGLGLNIAKGLVELHGGHAWVESTPGEGSAFYFTLPIHIAIGVRR